MLSFSIAIDNVNPIITHDKYAVIFIDVSTINDSISIGDIDSFMEITVSGPQTPPQIITDIKEKYEEHDETVLERVETIQNLGGEWHFHFDRPLYGDIFGIKLVNFIIYILHWQLHLNKKVKQLRLLIMPEDWLQKLLIVT